MILFTNKEERGFMRDQETENRLRGLASLVGNTPLLAIELLYRGEKRTLFAKAEHLSMTGSIKDRMAYNIMRRGYELGTLLPSAPIIEVTSGNTGVSFAAMGCALGHPVTILMPDWVSRERAMLIKGYGAEIIFFNSAEGGFAASISRAEELAGATANAFLPAQFSNADNSEAHYQTTGLEIWQQLEACSLGADAFVAGVGTGGTIMGVGRFLRERNPAAKIHPLEPQGFPLTASDKRVDGHRIEGLSDGFLPPLLDLDVLDGMVRVDDGDAILMAQKLANQLGLGVGISSGANLLGALQVQEEMGGEAVVVTVFADDNRKYLSTDLFRQVPPQEGFFTPEITLLAVASFP
ncbi:PLP-dependent cysteine synthase family protein [Thermodesulfobacteriota bacterium]